MIIKQAPKPQSPSSAAHHSVYVKERYELNVCWWLQVVLINAVKDVAKALGNLISTTKAAAGKPYDDPSMLQLKNSAKVTHHSRPVWVQHTTLTGISFRNSSSGWKFHIFDKCPVLCAPYKYQNSQSQRVFSQSDVISWTVCWKCDTFLCNMHQWAISLILLWLR